MQTHCQCPDFFGERASEKKMIGGFGRFMAERASKRVGPPFFLEVLSSLDTFVAQCPKEHVNLWDSFGIPNDFPDFWVGEGLRET
jgi:hypothetical protein